MNEVLKNKEKKGCFSGCLRIFGSATGCLLALLVLVFGGYYLLRAAGAFLIESNELEYANAIVVLSGGDESRMQEALRLYNDGYSGLIVLTETGNIVEGFDHLHSFDMRIELMSNGVPSGNILLTEQIVDSTVEEAQAVKALLQSRQLTSAIIVTDPYHSRRALSIFLDEFQDSGITVRMQAVRDHWYNSRTWFLEPRGWKFTILEYLKYIAYKLGIQEN